MRPTAADVPSRAMVGAAGAESPTTPHRSVGGGPRWLIQVDGGEFQLVESERELAELARMGRVTGSTPVYTVVDGPRPLGEVSDLVTFVPRVVSSEPPIRRSPEHATLSEELAILDRPLEDEIEYYDEVPVRRWPKRLALALAVAAGLFGAYLLVLPRFPTWRSSLTARLVLPARSWIAGSSPARTMPAQPAVLAVSARAEGAVAVAAPAVEPTHATSSPAPATIARAPSAEREVKSTEAPKAGRSHRRHRSGNHGPTGR